MLVLKNSSKLKRNDFSLKDEEEIYDMQLEEVQKNPRWFLDNLDYLPVYEVSWKDYRYSVPTLPYRFTKLYK